MLELEKEGEEIPEKLPCTLIDAKTEKDAKKILLLYNSPYAKFRERELNEWISEFTTEDLEEIDISEIKNISLDDIKKNQTENIESKSNTLCPKCGFKW